jgi:hypothetical protein
LGGLNFPEDSDRQRLAKQKNHENTKKCKIIIFSYGAKRLFSWQTAQKTGLFCRQYVFSNAVQAGSGVDGV